MPYDRFNYDIRRTIILGKYIEEWGFPEDRKVISKEGNAPIEIYLFSDNKLVRFVTIGLSAQLPKDSYQFEIMFASGYDMAGSSLGNLMDYVLDIAAFAVQHPQMFQVSKTLPRSPLAPKPWKMNCILVDAARGEPEHFENIVVLGGSVKVLWLIPLHGDEYDLIKKQGVEAFDSLCEEQELSVIDLNRKSFVPAA